MGTDFAVYYSDILRRTAREWGVDVPLDGLLDDDDIPLSPEILARLDSLERPRQLSLF